MSLELSAVSDAMLLTLASDVVCDATAARRSVHNKLINKFPRNRGLSSTINSLFLELQQIHFYFIIYIL